MSRTRRSVRKEAGFTLVEMAIVLIIIGLIIGAILKGQDLIDNARGKRLASFARGAEVSQWAYYDRFGRFAGDSDNDGDIDTDDTENISAALTAELDGFSGTLNLGSAAFYPTFGTNASTNFMALSNAATGNPTAFSDGAVIYAQMFDVAIDGAVNAENGDVQGASAITINAQGAVTAITDIGQSNWDTTATALIYYFD